MGEKYLHWNGFVSRKIIKYIKHYSEAMKIKTIPKSQ